VWTPAVVNGDFLIDDGLLVDGQIVLRHWIRPVEVFSVLIDDFVQLTHAVFERMGCRPSRSGNESIAEFCP
jgi:hypothetical protein